MCFVCNNSPLYIPVHVPGCIWNDPKPIPVGLKYKSSAHSELAVIAHACHGDTLLLSAEMTVQDSSLVVTLLEVSEREEGAVALHLSTGSDI